MGGEKPSSIKLTKSNSIPERLTVYDFFFEKKATGAWVEWGARLSMPDLPAEAKPADMIVPTVETMRMSFFLDLYLSHRIPFLEIYIPNTLNFSARTSANLTQDIIMSRLDRRRKGVFGPAPGKQCIVFVDDLNMPAKEVYGAQPPIELLRMWIDHGYWFDVKDNTKQNLIDVVSRVFSLARAFSILHEGLSWVVMLLGKTPCH
ncbi:unnamed protein product [Dibothriocephalus latus]|uniref:Dynein heavy chain AAA 5 extension domain-containing protein n=1 Tax=Dibothriocephalus latus TaxID=60516 RepID=A0A3P7LH70_DIBLA|nr:unnamed protein product [Dibothriocephalus latus]